VVVARGPPALLGFGGDLEAVGLLALQQPPELVPGRAVGGDLGRLAVLAADAVHRVGRQAEGPPLPRLQPREERRVVTGLPGLGGGPPGLLHDMGEVGALRADDVAVDLVAGVAVEPPQHPGPGLRGGKPFGEGLRHGPVHGPGGDQELARTGAGGVEADPGQEHHSPPRAAIGSWAGTGGGGAPWGLATVTLVYSRPRIAYRRCSGAKLSGRSRSSWWAVSPSRTSIQAPSSTSGSRLRFSWYHSAASHRWPLRASARPPSLTPGGIERAGGQDRRPR